MKKQLVVAVALGLASHTSAQNIWANGVCPAWTATDITGVQHSVYDYLDEGYTVIMDFGATWCAPCWDFRNTERLDSIYTLYGPGTVPDKVMVFFIELDPSTDLADLDGTGDQTMGDWISGTPYPIIDDASLAQQMQVSGFPFMVVACPNRMLFPIANMTFNVAQLLEQIWTCDPFTVVAGNDAAILPHLPYQQCAQETIGLTARLQNVGAMNLTNATIEAWGYAQFNDTLLGSTEWVGDLATYEEEMVTVTDWTPTAGSYLGINSVRIRLTTPDDRTENDESSQIVFASDVVADAVEVTFTFLTDVNGGEMYWELHDSGANIIASSLGASYVGNTLYSYNWTLSDQSCYTLFILDGGSDGLQDPGFYRLQANGVVLLEEHDFNDNADIRAFSIQVPSSIDAFMDHGVHIGPNPAGDMVVVSGVAGARLNVLDMAGRSVIQKLLRTDHEIVPVSELSEGIYTVMITRNGSAITKKVVIAR